MHNMAKAKYALTATFHSALGKWIEIGICVAIDGIIYTVIFTYGARAAVHASLKYKLQSYFCPLTYSFQT